MEIKDILANKPLVYASCLTFGILVGVAVSQIAKRMKKTDTDSEKEQNSHSEHVHDIAEEYELMRRSVSYANEDKVVGLEFSKPDLKDIVDYTKFSHKGEAVITENGKPVEEGDEPQEVNAPTVFEIISEEEFLKSTGNSDGYTSVVGTWYPEEKILTGWNEDEEDKDPRSTIGEEALSKFDDPEVKAVYVRNTHLKVLFEIVRALGSLGEEE